MIIKIAYNHGLQTPNEGFIQPNLTGLDPNCQPTGVQVLSIFVGILSTTITIATVSPQSLHTTKLSGACKVCSVSLLFSFFFCACLPALSFQCNGAKKYSWCHLIFLIFILLRRFHEILSDASFSRRVTILREIVGASKSRITTKRLRPHMWLSCVYL